MKEALIQISPPHSGVYTVRLYDSAFPADGAATVAAGTFTGGDLTAAPPTVTDIRAAAAGMPLRDIGERLFSWLNIAGVAKAWIGLATVGEELRTCLDICDELRDLPWEALAVPSPYVSDFVAFRGGWTLLRVHRPAADLVPVEPHSLVRILVVTGNKSLDVGIDADDDAISIEGAFQQADRCVHIEVLREPAAKPPLLTAFRELRPHIFHYIGHGGISPATGDPALLFGVGTPQSWAWSFDDIFSDMRDNGCSPRVAFLNACWSGAGFDGTISAGRAFGMAGTAAVVSMLRKVTVPNALLLTRSFYEQVAKGQTVDRALRVARSTVKDAAGGVGQSDWALPTLSISQSPEHALCVSPYVPEVGACVVRRQMYERGGRFIDRATERRKIIRSQLPFSPSETPVPGLVVSEDTNVGVNPVGKSWLVKRILADLVQAGLVVRYCELLGGERPLNSREVLRRFRHGDPQVASFAMAPLPGVPFAAYDVIQQRVTDIIAASGEDHLGSTDVDDLFNSFMSGIATVAETRPVVLVLDRFTSDRGSLPPLDFTTFLLPKLLRPIIEGAINGVRLMLVMSGEEMSRYGIADAQSLVIPELKIVRVPGFKEADAQRLFLEYCGFQRTPKIDRLREVFVDDVSGTGVWSPDIFLTYAALVRRLRTA